MHLYLCYKLVEDSDDTNTYNLQLITFDYRKIHDEYYDVKYLYALGHNPFSRYTSASYYCIVDVPISRRDILDGTIDTIYVPIHKYILAEELFFEKDAAIEALRKSKTVINKDKPFYPTQDGLMWDHDYVDPIFWIAVYKINIDREKLKIYCSNWGEICYNKLSWPCLGKTLDVIVDDSGQRVLTKEQNQAIQKWNEEENKISSEIYEKLSLEKQLQERKDRERVTRQTLLDKLSGLSTDKLQELTKEL